MAKQRSKPKRLTRRPSGPLLLLVAPPEHAKAVLPALRAHRWRVDQVEGARAAERHLLVAQADLLLVSERDTPAATLTLLRQLARAAPGTRRIVIGRKGDAEALLSYANSGGAHYVLGTPQSARRLVQAVQQVWHEQEYERAALLRGTDAGEVVAALQARMEERTREVSHANRELRRVLRDLAEKNRALLSVNETLRVQSTTDALTGLYNRREFLSRIRTEWGRFKRYDRALSLIMLDIDRFKAVNDTHGHECGDVVLRTLGQLIRRHKRAQDLCCRYGGEEFVVLLTETPLDTAFHVAEGLRQLVEAHPFEYEGTALNIRVSLGVAGAREQLPKDVDGFVNLADKAMYRAKQEGRNRTVVLDGVDLSRVARQTHKERATPAKRTRGGQRERRRAPQA